MNKHYSYKEIVRITYGALDLLPIKKFLEYNKGHEIQDVFRCIDYNLAVDRDHTEYFEFWEYLEHYSDFFEGDVLNWFDDWDFMTYCEYRYPEVQWHEETITRYTITDIREEQKWN